MLRASSRGWLVWIGIQTRCAHWVCLSRYSVSLFLLGVTVPLPLPIFKAVISPTAGQTGAFVQPSGREPISLWCPCPALPTSPVSWQQSRCLPGAPLWGDCLFLPVLSLGVAVVLTLGAVHGERVLCVLVRARVHMYAPLCTCGLVHAWG